MRSRTIIGENIYQLRRGRQWTQQQLGDAVGTSKSAISAYELGIVHPFRAKIEKLAGVLEVPAADLSKKLLKPEWAFSVPKKAQQPKIPRPIRARTPRVRLENAVGEDFSRRRVALGLTQEQFAAKVGVSFNTITTIEAGKKRPGRHTLNKLATFLGVAVAELGGEASPAEPVTLGQVIRAARWTKGWTQKELGPKVGAKTQTIWAFENDKYGPTAAEMARLAQVLDVPLEFFPEHVPEPKELPRGGIPVLLKTLGWTRHSLARVLGVSQPELARFEVGEKAAGWKKFVAWVTAMEVSRESRAKNRRGPRRKLQEMTPGNEIGDLIYRMRTARGISQRGLAGQVGVTGAAITNLERGRAKPGPKTRKRLALVLGVEEDQLTPPAKVRGPAKPLTLGQAIHTARQAKGWTQVELGQKVGEKGRVIAGYESDKTVPTRARLAQLARLLNVALPPSPQPKKAFVLSMRKFAAANRKNSTATRQEASTKQKAEAEGAKRAVEAAIQEAQVANRKAEAAKRVAEAATRKVEAAILKEARINGNLVSGDGLGPGLTLGQAILAARQARGWSQAELGQKVGMAGTIISTYERDKVAPSQDELNQLGRALRVRFVRPTIEETMP